MHTLICANQMVFCGISLLAYQKSSTSEHNNQLVYLEISECSVLDNVVPAALPNAYSVGLLEQWIGEQSSCVGELSIYGRLIANSSLYK